MAGDASLSRGFLCFGVGAIGTYVGGSLALSGQRVVFVERPEVAAEVRQNGVCVTLGGEERRLAAPEVVGSLGEALERGPFDAAILAVKSFDTAAVVAGAMPFRSQMPPVLCLQNGVENEQTIAMALGSQKAVCGSVTTAVGRLAAGKVVVEKLRGVGVAIDHPLGPALAKALEDAGLQAKTYPNGPSMKWSKMLTNLLANASSAILDMTPTEIFSHAGLYRMEIGMYKEALAVMAAQSIRVTDLPGTPIRLLTWMIRALPAALSQPLLIQSLGKGRGGKMPSFHIDLYAGRGRSEVDFLNGAVVRLGGRVGVQAPINRRLTEILMALTDGRLPKDEYAHLPEKLIQKVGSTELPG
jgi:2-dehydropantoate 2-reductase